MIDKPSRSLLKAISWRLAGTIDTLVISFLITRRIGWALTIGGVEFFTKILLYYIHERVWEKIPLGRAGLKNKTAAPAADAAAVPTMRALDAAS